MNDNTPAAKPTLARALRPALVAAACLALYAVAVMAKRRIAPADNVLAECMLVLAFVAPVAFIAIVVLYGKRFLSLEGAVNAACVFVLAAACFWLTVPAIFDRSVTLYLINTLENHADGMSEDEIRHEFIHVYFGESRGIAKRLGEQLDSGNVRYADGRYYLTAGGRRVLAVARALSGAYALDPNIVRARHGD